MTNYIHASNGDGEAARANISEDRAIGDMSFIVDSVLNWPAKFIATAATLGSDGYLTDMTIFFGYLAGGIIMIDHFASGYTDIGNFINQVIVLKPTTAWADEVAEAAGNQGAQGGIGSQGNQGNQSSVAGAQGNQGNPASGGNLTGDVTSVGYATTIAPGAVHASMLVTPPTRFVAIDPVTVVSNVDPADTNFVDVDATANTSATCYAVTGVLIARAATAGRAVYLRPNGSSATGTALQFITPPVANQFTSAGFTIGTDAGQIFEYAASNADVNSVYISITGYWETVA